MSYMFKENSDPSVLTSGLCTLQFPTDVSRFLSRLLLPAERIVRPQPEQVWLLMPFPSVCADTHTHTPRRPVHSLISCDSDILASVFLTRRAVRREAGLWAQHSVMSFPICLKHWGDTENMWEGQSSVCVCVHVLLCVWRTLLYLIAGPSIGKGGTQPLDAHHLFHVFIRRVCWN